MQPSQKCITLVKHYELFMPNPYLCPAGVATIGYGTTVYENGKKVSLTDPPITEADASDLLNNDLSSFSTGTNHLLKASVTQEQFDALLSFTYNLGLGALGKSTLLKLINENVISTSPGWKGAITKEFSKWNKAKVKGDLIELPGLTARRQAEAYLFCEGEVKFFTAPIKK